MQKHQPNKAFSLIEISIVVLIIGILISGVSLGVDLYKDFCITNAQSQIQNSRVNRIDGLVLWLEASQKSSFEPSNINDGQRITKWKNINQNILPQDRILNDANATTSTGPIYREGVVNNLPSIEFTPSEDQCLWVRSGFDGASKNSSIYLLIRSKEDWKDSNQPRILSRLASPSIYSMWDIRTNVLVVSNSKASTYNYIGTYVIKPNSTVLHELIMDRNNTIYYNIIGNANNSGVSSSMDDTTYSGSYTNAGLGIRCSGSDKASAYYSEIIIFDRALNVNERNDVKNYLIKKWNIKK